MYVSGSGLEGDNAPASALEALQHSTGASVILVFVLFVLRCLSFFLLRPSSLTHLIPPSPDLEAPFVFLICFFSSACHSGRGEGSLVYLMQGPSGAYCRGCHDNDDHASAAGPVAVPI